MFVPSAFLALYKDAVTVIVSVAAVVPNPSVATTDPAVAVSEVSCEPVAD